MPNEQEEVVFCCACGDRLARDSGFPINLTLHLPGEPPVECVAIICEKCDGEAHGETSRLVIQTLINTRIIRHKYPNIEFKPKSNDSN